MPRNVLKSNNSIMLITESPSFSTETKTGILFGGVTSTDFSFDLDRQTTKQIGSQQLATNTINRHPDVNFNVDYIFNPTLTNETLLGFFIETPTGGGHALKNMNNKNYNFSLINHPQEGRDALSVYSSSTQQFSGFEAISFGNAFLNNYSVGYSIGQLPIVQTNFSASNIKYEKLTGSITKSPAINLQNGNNELVGDLVFSGYNSTPDQSGKTPNFTRPSDLTLSLKNLQVGGQNLSGQHFVQSFDMSLNFGRVNLYGLGSDYVYDRKLQFPMNGSVSVSSLVSGFLSGQSSGLLTSESGYNLALQFVDTTQKHTGTFEIEDARLQNYDYTLGVNQSMAFNAQFSFESTNDKGLRISGRHGPDII
tara:strand:+ start:6410 stop:7504 length:1095 start_codon:yes stop_codon:yes gene_type:complete